MSTSEKIKQLLNAIQSLNRFDFSFDFSHDDFADEFTLHFGFPVQCALVFSLLHDMLIESTSIYLENGNKITILVVNHNICYNIDA